jgi:hypothetical protein
MDRFHSSHEDLVEIELPDRMGNRAEPLNEMSETGVKTGLGREIQLF